MLENPGAMPGARFFPSARLNFAENLLRYGDDSPPSCSATSAARAARSPTGELHEEVARVAAGLRPRVSARAIASPASCPTCPRPIIAMLATASLGADLVVLLA